MLAYWRLLPPHTACPVVLPWLPAEKTFEEVCIGASVFASTMLTSTNMPGTHQAFAETPFHAAEPTIRTPPVGTTNCTNAPPELQYCISPGAMS